MLKKFLAFTLSEILIALGVIGVVAVIVMPRLLAGQKAAQSLSQFNTAYALVSKAIVDMDTDGISVDPDIYLTRDFYAKFIKYNKRMVECGSTNASANTDVCPSSGTSRFTYKNITGENDMATDFIDDGAFVLTNGMLVAVENCPGCTPYGDDHNIWITVDINGRHRLPNKLGYDVFIFALTKDEGILPLGAAGTETQFSSSPSSYCCYPDRNINNGCSAAKSNLNGATCAYYASSDSDYFKRLYAGY